VVDPSRLLVPPGRWTFREEGSFYGVDACRAFGHRAAPWPFCAAAPNACGRAAPAHHSQTHIAASSRICPGTVTMDSPRAVRCCAARFRPAPMVGRPQRLPATAPSVAPPRPFLVRRRSTRSRRRRAACSSWSSRTATSCGFCRACTGSTSPASTRGSCTSTACVRCAWQASGRAEQRGTSLPYFRPRDGIRVVGGRRAGPFLSNSITRRPAFSRFPHSAAPTYVDLWTTGRRVVGGRRITASDGTPVGGMVSSRCR
jgi:hypothetical protein